MKTPSLQTILALGCTAVFAVTTESTFAQQPDAPAQKHGRHEGHRGEHDHGGPPDAGKHLEKLTQELGLTAEQQASIKPVLEAADARRKAIWENTALTQEDKHSQMKQVHEGVKAQLKGILTPEQQTKLDQHKPEPRHRGAGESKSGDCGDKPAK